jgi:AP-3 complex subunit beta
MQNFSTAALSTAASRLSARLQENLSESAREFGLQSLEGFTSGTGRLLESGNLTTDEGIRETKKLLESTKDKDRTDGLRRVLAVCSAFYDAHRSSPF